MEWPKMETIKFTDVWDEVSKFIADYKSVGIPTTIGDSNAMTLYYLLYARYGNSHLANYDIYQFKYKIFSIIFQYGPVWEKKLDIQSTLRALSINDLIESGKVHDLFTHEGESSETRGSTVTTDQDTTNTGTQTNIKTGNAIHNHAFNPETEPTTQTSSEIPYINEQTVDKYNNLTDTRTDSLASTNDVEVTTSENGSGSDSREDENTRTLTRGKLEGYEKLLSLLEDDFTKTFIDKFKYCFKIVVSRAYPRIYESEIYDEE